MAIVFFSNREGDKFGSTNMVVVGRDDVPRSVLHPEVTLDGVLRMCFYSDMLDLALVTVAATDPFGSKADDLKLVMVSVRREQGGYYVYVRNAD